MSVKSLLSSGLVSSTLILAFSAAALPAATLERLSLDEMIIKSTAIVRGKVLDSHAVSTGPLINTYYHVQVSETLKGPARGSVEIQFPGGVVNNTRQSFAGVPQFNVGDEYVFFLWAGKTGGTEVIGLTQGLFSVASGNTADPMTTRAASREVMLDRTTGKPVQDQTIAMHLSELRSRIKYIMTGRAN